MATKKQSLENTQFFKNLTQNSAGVKAARATLVAKQVVGELDSKVQELENELNQVELSISAHEDLSPDNKYSLSVASKDFQAKEWLDTLYELLDVKRLKEIELGIYLEIRKRQFGEDAE